MSQSWICALCGETVLSKCPSSRNTFPGMMDGIIGSVTTFNLVKDIKGGLSELFVSYTSGNDNASKAFADLVELMKDNMNYPSKNDCNHVFVINSHTKSTCTLDHLHPNLDDVEEIRASHGTNALQPQTLDRLMRQYADVASIAVEQARKDVNRTKDVYDHAVEEDFHFIKSNLRENMAKIADRVQVRDPFRVRVPRKHPEYDRCVHFRHKEDAIDFINGCAARGQVVGLEMLDEKGERYIDMVVTVPYSCVICKEITDVNKDIVVLTATGTAHLTCVKKLTDKSKVKVRQAAFEVRFDNRRFNYDDVIEQYGLISCWYGANRRNQPDLLHISVKADTAGLDDIIAGIKYYLN
jgi:hypothetical protein